jgi:hypothetical protein
MLGTEEARRRTRDRLGSYLPAKVAAIRGRHDPPLTEVELPPPALIATPDRPRLDAEEWPAVMVVCNGAPRLRRVDIDETGASVFERAYAMRVYVYARAETFEAVADIRDRYTLALVETLLDNQNLDGAGHVEETTFAQSDSEILPDSTGRSTGAAYLDFELRLTETLAYNPAGRADTLEVVAGPNLPPV